MRLQNYYRFYNSVPFKLLTDRLNIMLLENRVILVTGAGYGIGRSAALTYAREGATVILLGRTEQALNDTYDLIEAEGLPQPAVLPFDLENTEEERSEEHTSELQSR